MSYDRVLRGRPGSEDCLGRAVWALGTTVQLAHDDGQPPAGRGRCSSGRCLARAELGPRGTALTMLGLASLLAGRTPATRPPDRCWPAWRTSWSSVYQRRGHRATGAGSSRRSPTTTPCCRWPCSRPIAITGERSSLRVARESLEFLEEICFRDGQLVLVGNAGWHRRGGAKAPSRRAGHRRGRLRAGLPRRLPGHRRPPLPAAACASRSPGSWAPTACGCRSTTSSPGLPRRAGRRRRSTRTRAPRAPSVVPAVPAGDAGAGG